MPEDVLVIGAGPAGLSSAYFLEAAGVSYRVVDKSTLVGSTWANLYQSLRLNTAHFVSHLPGQRLPLRLGFYPLGRDFYAYLKRYADDHRFNVHLGVEVYRVAPEEDGWRVESSEGTAWYPAVIIATGRFGNPYMPHIPGQETFTGRLMHAGEYRRPGEFADQRVIVVGSGPSAGDIAAELGAVCKHPVLLAIRSDIIIARRYPLGIPETIWRVALGVLPKNIREPLLNRISYLPYPGMDKFGMRLAPDRDHRVGTSAPIRGPEIVRMLKLGRVIPVAGLARLDGERAVLDDGSEHPADTVIMATGYRPVLNYLDIDYTPDKDGWIPRDPGENGTGQGVVGYPGLYVVGRFYRGLGPLHNMHGEAQSAVAQIQARLKTINRRDAERTEVNSP